MELSLQSKISYKKIYNKRRFMLKKEHLHIEDELDYIRFQKLYEEYGEGLTQKEFAKYFLDVDYASYYRLQAGIRDTSTILTREFYQEEELEKIRKAVLEDTGLKRGDTINDEKLKELHDLYGNRFSLKMFAEEVLALNDHRVNDLNANKSAEAKVLTKEFIDGKQIRQIRETLVRNEPKLHIDSKINLEEFEELYKKYVTPELNMDKEAFALKVLKVAQDTFKRFLKGSRKDVLVFSSYPISPDYIASLRENVILSENLHIEDSISVERFESLYEKYAGILTKEVFAEEILDTPIDTVKNAKRRNNNITVLTKIDVPKEFLKDLKDRVKNENRLGYNDKRNLKQLRALYKKYGGILSEKQFFTQVLEVSENSYNFLKAGTVQESYIFTKYEEIDFEKLRKKVIEENKLHYADKISYKEFHKIHLKYGPEIREHIFAQKVLDISQTNLDNLRHDKKNSKTMILLEEPLPTDKEIETLKKLIISKYKFHRKDKIDYLKFKKIYNKYSGIMPEDFFANKIFDIHSSVLGRIKKAYRDNLKQSNDKNETGENRVFNKDGETEILLKTFMKPEDLEDLKKKVRIENKIYPGRKITLKEFNLYYNKYEHILSRNEFAKQVVNIEREKLRKLENEEKEEVVVTNGENINVLDSPDEEIISQIKEYMIGNLSKEQMAGGLFVPLYVIERYLQYIKDNNILSIKELRKNKRKKDDKNVNYLKSKPKVKKILDNFLYDSKNVTNIENWLDFCMENIEAKDFPKEDIDLLGDAIVFAQSGSKSIQYYTQICINNQKYKKAHIFISDNIDNEGITEKEKRDLRKLQQHLRNAMKKEKAVELILNGVTNVDEIAKSTGILEVEIVGLKKRLLSQKPEFASGPEM